MAGNGERAGSLLGRRYRLLNQIGSGGHGTLWAAEDEALGGSVTLRRIHWHAESEQSDRERRLAVGLPRRLARFRGNPRILTVLDVLLDDDGVWVVVEDAAGARTLADILRESGPLPPARVARFGLGVLLALTVMHTAGMTHGHLTPEKILVTPEDEILLVGFDEAMLREPALSQPAPTDAVVGTPRFMAPELILGRRLTPAADLFSLGSVMYEAVEGHGPFDRRTPLAVAYAVVSEEPATPYRAGALGPVLRRLLTKDPSLRPTAEEVARLLEDAGEGRGEQASPWAELPPDAEEPPEPQAPPDARPQPYAQGTAPGSLAPTPYAPETPWWDPGPWRSQVDPAGRRNAGWAWTGLVIASLTVVLLAVLVGYVLPSLDGMWWLPGLWVFLVAAAVTNALRRTAPSEAATTATTEPPDSRAAPRRGAALLAGATDAAVFLRPRTAVPPLSPTRDAYLREAYNRLGPPPPAVGTRPPGGSA